MTTSMIRVKTSASLRRAAAVCVVAGLLGAGIGVFLIAYPGQVPQDRYSYPVDTDGFTVVQIMLFVQHLGLVAGLLALRPAGVLGVGRVVRAGWIVAVVGMLLLAVTELIGISAADATYPSSRTDPLDALYATSSYLIAVGLVATGVGIVRAGHWSGWRRWVVLATGVYVFVPMTPALIGPFIVARVAIGVWMLLFAAIGWALLTEGHREEVVRG